MAYIAYEFTYKITNPVSNISSAFPSPIHFTSTTISVLDSSLAPSPPSSRSNLFPSSLNTLIIALMHSSTSGTIRNTKHNTSGNLSSCVAFCSGPVAT